MKIHSRILPLLALTFVVGASSVSFAGPKNGGARAGKAGKMGKMAQELNLTEAQKSQLQPILRAAKTQRQALRENTTLSPEQKRTQMRELMSATQTQIAAILTPVQMQKMAEMKRERREQRQENGGAANGGTAKRAR